MKLPPAQTNQSTPGHKARATQFIFSKISAYIDMAVHAGKANEPIKEARTYIDSINRYQSLTNICIDILRGRPQLFKLLPTDAHDLYGIMQDEINSIVQFCFDQKRSGKDVSTIIIRQIKGQY